MLYNKVIYPLQQSCINNRYIINIFIIYNKERCRFNKI